MVSEFGSRNTARLNRRAVLREVVLSGPVARTEIATRVGLTAGAVSRIARPLIDAGLVLEMPEQRGKGPVRPGRRIVPLDINPEGGQVLGIAIAPTYRTIHLADIKNNVIAGIEIEPDAIEDPDQVVRRVARESRRLIGAHLDDRSRLLGGFLMITGDVDRVRGDVLEAPYLGWGQFPLRARLADFLDLPMTVRSMTATIASAETLFGAARGWDHVLTLLCGLGIGAAVTLDGRLVEGSRFSTSRIGNLTVAGEDGVVATLDELGSGLGLLRRLHGDDMTPAHTTLSALSHMVRETIERERAGDQKIGALTTRAGRGLGQVIVQFARFVSIEVVVIAGPLSMSPGYVTGVREAVAEGMAPAPAAIIRSAFTGKASAQSPSCAMAIYQYLLERPLDFEGLGVRRA